MTSTAWGYKTETDTVTVTEWSPPVTSWATATVTAPCEQTWGDWN